MREFKALDKALRIESERLLLRPINIDDTELVLSLRNADYVRRNFFYRAIISKSEHEDYFLNKCEKGLVFEFLVYEKESGDAIGVVYLQHYDEKEDSLESGLFFSENAPKKNGYATEAIKMLNDFAFADLGVSKTIATVISTNDASMNLHARAGFKETKRTEVKTYPDNESVIAVSFELTPEALERNF
ncbi:MAG: GNAT family N-acetyltransferase [Lachnospiraceae bacterium]|nr:GNAT family N-acetyltransferase [Lachnospiraceae bacterium]